jgi:hypothetical protein
MLDCEDIEVGSLIKFSGYMERLSGKVVSEVVMNAYEKEGVVVDISNETVTVLSGLDIFILDRDSLICQIVLLQ